MDLTFIGPRIDTHDGHMLLICCVGGHLLIWADVLPQQAQLVSRCTERASDLWGSWL
jgi:hypothetical protein